MATGIGRNRILSNKLSFLKIVSFYSLTQKTYSKETKFVTLAKVLSKIQLVKCVDPLLAAILDFIALLPNMLMTKYMDA